MADLRNVFTAKQVEVLHQFTDNKDWKLMINSGAVRAGKTFVDNFLFLLAVRHAAEIANEQHKPFVQFILAGASSKTIQSNILDELKTTFDLEFKFDKHGSFQVKFPKLPPVKVVMAYTKSIAGLSSIRGMTAYGAYINEASLANELVFDEIQKRCSGKDARIICDTNPDVPTHFLKKIIDRAEETDDKTVVANHFTIFDNEENLDPVYLQHLLNTTPTGMLYDRDILGQWTSGEGIVYADFDIKQNIISLDEFNAMYSKPMQEHGLKYVAGVDWGFEHKGCIVVIAIDRRTNNYYLVEEHTHKHWQGQQWLNKAREIIKRYGNIPFYCDSARPEYVSMFQRDGIHAYNAYKRILRGVEIVGGLIKSRQFKVIKERINYFEKELFEYNWDESTGEPEKKDGNDDVMDTMRYAIATYVNIQETRHATYNNNQSYADKANVVDRLGLI
ncbi:PBSX family phage terminase large subunit [Lactobacillus kunkeei]|nr:PBSX family phage terminase large subunit [Apilactobacillus kunkeei]